jgi:hypothetical protein
MGLAARRKAEAQFTLNVFGEQFPQLLKCLVCGGSRGPVEREAPSQGEAAGRPSGRKAIKGDLGD